MIDITNITLIVCVALGFALGILSGLTPGLHLNNFAAMLLALSPSLINLGLTPYEIASIIVFPRTLCWGLRLTVKTLRHSLEDRNPVLRLL